MKRPDWLYSKDDEHLGLARQLAPGVNTRIFTGANSMLSLVRIEPHFESPLHHHPEEQWGYLIEGECIRIQGGLEVEVRPGDFWHTPGNVEHAVRTGESGALILDIFSPPREAYTRS